jgi:hypothetical protein
MFFFVLYIKITMNNLLVYPLSFIFVLPRMELRSVIAVIRHGERTPKQKMKLAVLHPL